MKKHLLTAVLLVSALNFTPGTAHADSVQPQGKYVARTSTLQPAPLEQPKVEPVVKVEEVRVEAPKTPEPTSDSMVRSADSEAVSYGGLTGSIGYARAGGNCVNQPGVHKASGNPISWPVFTQYPSIGATALFNYNHVGVVTGIWDNGDLEIAHQNYKGGQHRFPVSAFRGFR